MKYIELKAFAKQFNATLAAGARMRDGSQAQADELMHAMPKWLYNARGKQHQATSKKEHLTPAVRDGKGRENAAPAGAPTAARGERWRQSKPKDPSPTAHLPEVSAALNKTTKREKGSPGRPASAETYARPEVHGDHASSKTHCL